jgi:hypothetical protein
MSLFGIDMPAIFAAAMGDKLIDATLTKVFPGTYDITNPSAGNRPSSITYTCKAVAVDIVNEFVAADQTRGLHGKVLILLGTMSAAGVIPAPGDTITMASPGGGTLVGKVTKADTDPAGVQSTCDVLG